MDEFRGDLIDDVKLKMKRRKYDAVIISKRKGESTATA